MSKDKFFENDILQIHNCRERNVKFSDQSRPTYLRVLEVWVEHQFYVLGHVESFVELVKHVYGPFRQRWGRRDA